MRKRIGLNIFLLIITFFPFSIEAKYRIATSDWSIAETLTAMNHIPVSVADRKEYDIWVNSPPLPQSTKEAGLRFQPNLERLYQIKPDFFIQSSWFAPAKPQFEKIAPVYELDFNTQTGIEYTHALKSTRELGKLVHDSAAAEKLIRETETLFAQIKPSLTAYQHRPLAVVQFADSRHLRIYGKTSLFQAVMDKLGLKNAWTGKSNVWGFTDISLVDLAKLPPNTLLIIVKPHPQNTRHTLEKSILWQRLPFHQTVNRRILPPTWSNGALPAMQRFAKQLADKLPSEKEMPW